MIARPLADLINLNVLPVPPMAPAAAKAVEGGVQPRFDAALLQAAKTVRDSAPEGVSLNLSPKVQQALESVLADLSQKPLDQLKTLAKQPEALKPALDKAASAAGLNGEEQGALEDLVPMALPKLVELKGQIEIPGTMPAVSKRDGEVQPGPQGGTPAVAASPVDPILGPQAGPAPVAPHDPRPAQDVQEKDSARLTPLAAAAFAPVLVSTRTDDGSGKGPVSLNRNAEVSAAPVASPAPAQRTIAVSVQEANAPAPVAGKPLAPAPQPVQGAAAQAPVAPSAPATPAAAPPAQAGTAPAPARSPQAATQAEAQAAAAAPGRTVSPAPAEGMEAPEAGVARQAQAPRPAQAPEAGVQARAFDMDVRTLDASAQVPVKADSVVTLTGDGRWILPTDAQAAQPQPTAKAVAAPANPAAAPQPQPKAVAPAQPQPQAVPAQAEAPAAPAQPQPQAQPQGQAQAPVSPQAPPQAQPLSPEPTVQAAAVAQASSQPQPAKPVQPASAQAPAVEGADEALSQAANSGASAVQARRQGEESAFSGLANFGQDPLKALATQTARDYAVKRAVFEQVAEALREAPDKESGRLLIRLKPAHLGEVQVDLILEGGKLSARLVASQGEVRDAFVRDLPAFKAGLESHGVAVREVSVAVRAGVSDQQGQPQQPQQDWRQLLPREEAMGSPLVPASAGYLGGLPADDQRFSALA